MTGLNRKTYKQVNAQIIIDFASAYFGLVVNLMLQVAKLTN